ncbi:hypothetical protein C0585_07155 [Candidatus Woesearchaeota archaeon]|nr:MAG: hypothetical protein C0585_07155 [Candidatus Woesearchaeota archaeon]
MSQKIIFENLEKVINSKHWNIYGKSHITVQENIFPIEAHIRQNWDIYCKFVPNLEKIATKTGKIFKIQNNYEDMMYSLMFSLMFHEKGHWDVCPFDLNGFEQVLSGAAKGIESLKIGSVESRDKNKRNNYINTLRHCVNQHDDIIVNTVNSAKPSIGEEYRKGLSLITLMLASSSILISGQKSKSYTVFNDINNKLWQDDLNIQKQWQKLYHNDYKNELEEIVEKAINIFTKDGKLTQKAMKYDLSLEDKKLIALKMSNRNLDNWYHSSKEYAKLIAPLLQADQEDNQQNMPQYSNGSSFIRELFDDVHPDYGPSQDQNGDPTDDSTGKPTDNLDDPKKDQDQKESKGRSDEMKIEEEKSKGNSEEQDQNNLSGSSSDEESKSIEKSEDKPGKTKEEPDLYKMINEEKLKNLIQAGSEKGRLVNFAQKFHLLDGLYEQRAQKILISLNDESKVGDSTRIKDLISIVTNEDNINLKRTQWNKTRIYMQEGGLKNIELFQGDVPFEIPDPATPGFSSIPDLNFIVDTSSSMGSDLLEGEGPYDTVLRACYAMFKYIEQTGKGYHMKFSSTNFSYDTRFSGWKSYHDLEKFKKTLFHFQNGGTRLDVDSVRKMYKEKTNPFLSILLTDGAFSNSHEASIVLKELVDDGNHLSVIHIYHDWYSDPKRSGSIIPTVKSFAETHTVRTPEDLIGLNIGYAKKYWG